MIVRCPAKRGIRLHARHNGAQKTQVYCALNGFLLRNTDVMLLIETAMVPLSAASTGFIFSERACRQAEEQRMQLRRRQANTLFLPRSKTPKVITSDNVQHSGRARAGLFHAGYPHLTASSSFKPVDFVAKPPLEDLFASAGIQSGDGSALLIERNMVTRNIFALAGLGNVLHENAFSARMTTLTDRRNSGR